MKNIYALTVALFLGSWAMAQWVPQNSGTTNSLNSVYFTDAYTGYASGGNIVLKTTDGGAIWTTQYSINDVTFGQIFFPTTDTGYAVGVYANGVGYPSGVIINTNDGGTNWTFQSGYGLGVSSVHFPSTNTGYATSFSRTGWNSHIMKTTNGTNWEIIYSTTCYPYCHHSLFFINVDTGYTVCPYGRIYKTVDGGANWEIKFSDSTVSLFSAHFPNKDTGYVAGDSAILKTTDGGDNWSYLNTGGNSIFFTDANIGYAIGQGGCILKTIDGGANWVTQYSDTTLGSQIHFPTADTGYVVGRYGTILKTTNGGGYPFGTNDFSFQSITLKIYPNPTSTNITIETQATGSLSILNVSGQAIQRKEITEPNTIVDVCGLNSGVYFVRVTSDKNVLVGKFIKQ